MTTLVTGIVGLRLAADAVLGLWQRAGEQQAQPEDRTEARRVLLGAVGRVSGWYRDLAADLGQATPSGTRCRAIRWPKRSWSSPSAAI